MTTATPVAADACVGRSARSLTHLRMRSLPCSRPPSPRLATDAARRFSGFRSLVPGGMPTAP